MTAAQPAQIGTKGVDEKGFFDVRLLTIYIYIYVINYIICLQLKTSKRTYNFYATNANLAQEWTEKLQACLQ